MPFFQNMWNSWNYINRSKFFYFLVCLFGVYRPIREFFTHMEKSPLPVKGCKFDLCSALMTIEQWGFFSVLHLLRHGPTLYNGHLRGPVTLTPFGSGAVTTCFYDLGLSRLPLRHRGGPNTICNRIQVQLNYQSNLKYISHFVTKTICNILQITLRYQSNV